MSSFNHQVCYRHRFPQIVPSETLLPAFHYALFPVHLMLGLTGIPYVPTVEQYPRRNFGLEDAST